LVELLLYATGRLERTGNLPPVAALRRKYGADTKTTAVISGIGEIFIEYMKSIDLKVSPKIDPGPFMREAMQRYGKLGLDMSSDFIQALAVQMEIKSPYLPRIQSDLNIIELEDLFRSEGLPVQDGTFFDQRYIDFINRNFERIDEINWRKFEALTAEYFVRQGCEVDIGPGRNDDGVDLRVWPSKDSSDKPPAIIIQCKRQKAQIPKVIVKSLYADIVDEKATSGLVVTTSRLSPGAKAVCDARKYPISSADRETIRQWVRGMRSPGMGIAT
jgi:restriction system protein